MKLLLATVPGPQAAWEGEAYINRVREMLHGPGRERFSERHVLTDDAAAADAILVLEPQLFKTKEYARRLLQSEPIAKYPQKCFTLNYDDAPVPYFRGFYTSLPQKYFDPRRHRSFCYPFPPHRQCDSLEDRRNRPPTLLFSFRGGATHPCRQPILDHAAAWMRQHSCRVTQTTTFYNQTPQDQAQFVEELIDSQFVLCPRGLGASSHRLFETMQMQRVPVIISDAWVEPAGPRWSDFSLRVAERHVGRLPELIAQAAPRSKERGALARKTWEDYFSECARFGVLADQLEELAKVPSDEAEFRKSWMSASLYFANHGTPLERIIRRTKKALGIKLCY